MIASLLRRAVGPAASGPAAWVEYCNGTGDTRWANPRRRNGHPKP